MELGTAAAGLTGIGSAVSALGTLGAGKSAKQAADFTAAQKRMAGDEALASGQRSMLERKRETDMLQSTLQARAAASGGGGDTGVLDLAGDIAQRGSYLALTELYKGQNKKRGLYDAAAGDQFSGDAALRGAQLGALGTLLGGAGSAFKLYGPKTSGL
jgi:hypothetical protein